MDKVKLEVKIPEDVTIKYEGIDIKVTPFLTVAKQIVLINQYVQDYFNQVEEGTGYTLLNAEFNLKNYLFQTNTNIDTENMDNDIYVDDGLWSNVTKEIKNWYTFRTNLNSIIEEKKRSIALENSIGKVLSDLANKSHDLLDKLADISPEQIEKTRETGIELIQKLQDSSVLGAGSIQANQKEK